MTLASFVGVVLAFMVLAFPPLFVGFALAAAGTGLLTALVGLLVAVPVNLVFVSRVIGIADDA